MTSNKRYFAVYKPLKTPEVVRVGNKQTIRTYGKSTINVEMKIRGKWQQNHLTDIWFVPKISRNLFSISQNIEKGFKFKADERSCQFEKKWRVKNDRTKNGEKVVCTKHACKNSRCGC